MYLEIWQIILLAIVCWAIGNDGGARLGFSRGIMVMRNMAKEKQKKADWEAGAVDREVASIEEMHGL